MQATGRRKRVLTDTAVRKAKPRCDPYKLTDGEGLYLYVAPSGRKIWRYDYRFIGKRQTVVLGQLDWLSLSEAREAHNEARKLLGRGVNPADDRQRKKQAQKFSAENTFGRWAERWYAEYAPHRKIGWRRAVSGWLKNWILPKIGAAPLESLAAADVLRLMHEVKDAGRPRLSEKIRWQVSRVFEHAIRHDAIRFNPARSAKGAIEAPRVEHHRPLSAKELPAFLLAIADEGGRADAQIATEILVHTFVRKSELIQATWDEIDLQVGEWRIPKHRMKQREAHIVPLSRQVRDLFAQLLLRRIQSTNFVFPNQADPRKPMSAYTLNVAFDRIGDRVRSIIKRVEVAAGRFSPENDLESAAMKLKSFEKFVPHGVRATASTLLYERGYRPDAIERQLAHSERSRVRAAYNRADYLEERRRMMQDWSDYLDSILLSSNISNIGQSRARALL